MWLFWYVMVVLVGFEGGFEINLGFRVIILRQLYQFRF